MLSTGYFFKDNIKYFKEVIVKANEKNSSGIGIKVGRFLDEIPQEIIELCDKLNFPLVDLPKNAAWMEIANAINEIVLDKYIIKLNSSIESCGIKDHDRKVNEIIGGLSKEIGKKVEVYDFLKNEIYSSSDKSIRNARLNDYEYIWNPNSEYEKKNLSDRLNIFRIKSSENSSRIIVPLEIDNALVAYLVAWENTEINDYYDLYVMRLSCILLLYEYGSMYFENSLKDKFQDELIHQIIENRFQNETQIVKRVLDINRLYLCISIRQFNSKISLYEFREKISRCIYSVFGRNEIFFGLRNDEEIVMMYRGDKSLNQIHDFIRLSIDKVIECLEKEIKGSEFVSGVCRDFTHIKDIKESYIESFKSINIARYIYPKSKVNFYDDLGIFKFINIEQFKQENMSIYNKYLKPLIVETDGQELIFTLKQFLECNLNYSLTAKKMFIHNNTVRYRINKIRGLINFDWEDSTERLKIEMVLKFLELFK